MSKWKDTLKLVAPLAGTMIGGPLGGIAGKAIGAIFGHTEDAPPDEMQLAKYIENASPDQIVKLREIDANLKTKLKEMGVKETDLIMKDKDSARNMQVLMKSHIPAILVIVLTIGFFVSLITLIIVAPPEGSKSLVYFMLGSLTSAWLTSIQFYFGTTKSSQDKTNLMGGLNK